MSDRPIIFSAPMVRALLDDRKTQTRRLATSPLAKCSPGDRLWVREGWHAESWYDRHSADQLPDVIAKYRYPKIWHQAGYKSPLGIVHFCGLDFDAQWSKGKGRPSIHMPRWASRLTLIVEAVKVEPLQDISEADAKAEGIVWSDGCGGWTANPEPNDCRFFHGSDPRRAFEALWCGIHGEDAWASNLHVVAITFRVEHANIDSLARAA